MQRCALGHGAASSEIHVRHVHRYCIVLYLVCQWHFLGCLTPGLYNRIFTSDNDSTFTQVHIEKSERIRHGWQVDASGTGVG